MNINDLSVLLVEPSYTQQQIIRAEMNELGIIYVEGLDNGTTALEKMPQIKPDLVVSSFYLPDMTGIELVKTMRKDDCLLDTAFMLISSETNFSCLEEIRQAGAIAILPKPFEKDALRTAIDATLDYIDSSDLELDHIETDSLQILVVDDSSMSRKHVVKILGSMGIINIKQANNGKEAAELINENYFDLVISDYNMPEMDGLELVDYIRQKSQQPGLPIMMVTSESNKSRLSAVQKSGVSAICQKIFEPKSIKSLMERLLQN